MINDLFIQACEKNDIHNVEFFLTDPTLPEHADINYQNNLGLLHACNKGYLGLVDFLLASPNLKIHADIQAQDNSPLMQAVNEGHLELLKYLTTSPKLKEHADIHAQDDYAFVLAFKRDDAEMVKFFLEDKNLKSHIDVYKHIDDFYHYHNREFEVMYECKNRLEDTFNHYASQSPSGTKAFFEFEDYRREYKYEYKVLKYLVCDYGLYSKDKDTAEKIADMVKGLEQLEITHRAVTLNNVLQPNAIPKETAKRKI